MKRGKVNYMSIVAILVLLCLSYFYFFKGLIEGSKYGKSANVIREYVKVPVIESYMEKVRTPGSVEGGRWENQHEENGLIHAWKIVSPNVNGYILDGELDAFKKLIDSKKYWQLNVNSKIIGDSVSERKGTLRLYNGNGDNLRHLDENGLDSIFKEWALESMVKGHN